MRYLIALGILILGFTLSIHENRKPDTTTQLSTDQTIRSGEPMPKGRTSVVPRGLPPYTAPYEPRTLYLKGSSRFAPQPYRFQQGQKFEHNVIGPMTSEKV